VTGDGQRGISHAGVGCSAIGSQDPEASGRNLNGRRLELWLPWLAPVTRECSHPSQSSGLRFPFECIAQPL